MARLERALGEIGQTPAQPETAQRARAEVVLDALASIPAAIFVADDRGRYIDANAAATLLTGYSRAELLRLSVWDLTPDARQGLGRKLWRQFIARGRMAGRYQLKTKSGETVSARYFAAAHALEGVHVSALVVERRRKPRPVKKPSRRSGR